MICKPFSFFNPLFFAVYFFFGLSSFDTVTTLGLSYLALFLLFFKVIPEIFHMFVVKLQSCISTWNY